MPYMQAFSPCIFCSRVFSYNPLTVPSTNLLTGEREPICRDCMDKINAKRVAQGLKPVPIAADAYEAAECLE